MKMFNKMLTFVGTGALCAAIVTDGMLSLGFAVLMCVCLVLRVRPWDYMEEETSLGDTSE